MTILIPILVVILIVYFGLNMDIHNGSFVRAMISLVAIMVLLLYQSHLMNN